MLSLGAEFGTWSGTVLDGSGQVSFRPRPARIRLKLPTSPTETDRPRPETDSRCAENWAPKLSPLFFFLSLSLSPSLSLSLPPLSMYMYMYLPKACGCVDAKKFRFQSLYRRVHRDTKPEPDPHQAKLVAMGVRSIPANRMMLPA